MSRIRTIKPEFWTDSFMVQLPPLARLLFIALWSVSDDHGCVYDEPDRLAMEVMPREDPLMVDGWVQLFWAAGKLDRCVGPDGVSFWQIKRWLDHQRIDKPSKCKFLREGSRKLAIPLEVRRGIAEKYGCLPGGTAEAECYYCQAPGHIFWPALSSGRPGSWVTFPGLELDHLEAEAIGGETSSGNMVLACRRCNRSKGPTEWFVHLMRVNGAEPSRILAEPREPSPLERKGKEGKGIKPPQAQAASVVDKPRPAQPPEDPRAASLKAICSLHRVSLNAKGALHIAQWVTDGVTVEQLTQAIGIARERKPDPAVIPVAYLAPIVSDVLSGIQAGAPTEPTPEELQQHWIEKDLEENGEWWRNEDEIVNRGSVEGVDAIPGQPFEEYTARVLAAAGPGPWREEADVAMLERIEHWLAVGVNPPAPNARRQPIQSGR